MSAVTAALIASAVVAVGSAYESHRQGGKAADAQKESSRIAGNQSKIQEQSKRRQAVREERVRRAQIAQSAEAGGVAGGSGEIGSTGALGSVTGGNVASSFQADRTSQRLTSLQGKVIGAQQRAQTAQAVGQVAGTVFQSLGGAPALGDAFGKKAGTGVDDQVTRLVGTSGLF